MEDGDCVTQVAVIGVLKSTRLALQTAQFVKKIEMLKIGCRSFPRKRKLIFPEVTFREDLVGSLPSSERTGY